MSKKYKINSNYKVFYKGKLVINETLTNKIAEDLLSTGQYENIIEVTAPKKKKQNGSEKSNS